MGSTQDGPIRPDGIGEEHERPVGTLRRHASPLSLIVFGTVVALGLAGVFGHEREWRAESTGVALAVHAPEIIRNGEFFEMRIRVVSDEPIGELVIGVEQALWTDMTVNTMIPAAAEEQSTNGEFRFSFDALEPATPFLLKVDMQVNPDIVGGNDGRITVYDGDEALVDASVSIGVMP